MDTSSVANQQGNNNPAPAPSTRNRAEQDYARQRAADDAVRQERRAANNRDVARRLASSALRESIERERMRERQNMEAGVEKMVRSVVRKASAQTEPHQSREDIHQSEQSAQADYVRDKLNSTYNQSNNESIRDDVLRPSPSEIQQQRARENYQESNRNPVDRTVELVV